MKASRDSFFRSVLAWYPLVFPVLCAAAAWASGFHQHHNDFWDVWFVADHLNPSDRQTWFNPQYPIGYTLALRALPASGFPALPAILLNALFCGAILAVSSRLFRTLLPLPFAAAAVILLSLFPEFFGYVSVGGGDPGAVAFFTAGAALALWTRYVAPDRDVSARNAAAGLLLGAAALFRYHAFPAAVLFALALLVVWPRRYKSVLWMLAGIALAYSPQWAVNLLAGRRLFETQFGPMNVYDLMHGLNWHRITSLRLPASVPEIIAADPGLFLRRYLVSFWSFKQAWLPPLLAVAVVRDRALRRLALAIALWTTPYFLMFSATTSGRQVLLALPLAMLTLGMVVHALWPAGEASRTDATSRPSGVFTGRALLVFFVIALMAVHVRRDVAWMEKRSATRASFDAVASLLKAEGLVRAQEVFTSDFDLYFDDLDGTVPYFNGGAPRLGTYGYNERYPEFPVETLAEFRAACRARGVRFVVLNREAGQVSPALDTLYSAPSTSSALEGFVREGDAGGYRIFSAR